MEELGGPSKHLMCDLVTVPTDYALACSQSRGRLQDSMCTRISMQNVQTIPYSDRTAALIFHSASSFGTIRLHPAQPLDIGRLSFFFYANVTPRFNSFFF